MQRISVRNGAILSFARGLCMVLDVSSSVTLGCCLARREGEKEEKRVLVDGIEVV